MTFLQRPTGFLPSHYQDFEPSALRLDLSLIQSSALPRTYPRQFDEEKGTKERVGTALAFLVKRLMLTLNLAIRHQLQITSHTRLSSSIVQRTHDDVLTTDDLRICGRFRPDSRKIRRIIFTPSHDLCHGKQELSGRVKTS
jgi:hypothetical protein